MSTKLIIGGVVAVALLIIIVYVATRPPKGLYMLQKPDTLAGNGTDYTGGLNYNDSITALAKVGGVVATKTQLAAAYAKTWDHCSWGWIVNDTNNNTPTAMYATHNTSSGCGGPGIIIGKTDQTLHWYTYGYGPRPAGVADTEWCQL